MGWGEVDWGGWDIPSKVTLTFLIRSWQFTQYISYIIDTKTSLQEHNIWDLYIKLKLTGSITHV